MTEQEYNNAEGIRRSDLWKMEDSPEKFRYYLEHPIEQTPAMAFGSACHKAILEPDDFGKEYVKAPNIDRRTNAGKEEWKKFLEENEGKTFISQDDVDTIAEMEKALLHCPLAKKLIYGKGQSEVPLFWTDPETGEKCKVKCDRIVTFNRRKYIVDYKTTVTAETNRFNSEMWRLGYHFQAGMYTEGMMHALKLRKRPGFLFVDQEKKPPYSVNVIEASEELIEAGAIKFRELMDKYHNCKVLDMWPGYVGDVPNDAFVPGWYEREMEGETE